MPMKWNECNLIAFGFVMGGVSIGVLEAVPPLIRSSANFLSAPKVGFSGRRWSQAFWLYSSPG
jgi:hypothetical protein